MSTRLQYFKRYRMEIDLTTTSVPSAVLPDGYLWNEWNDADVERHALTKHRSFRDEVDSEVFPSLGEYFGCVRLMHEISQQETFLGPATWLISWCGGTSIEDCGTIQRRKRVILEVTANNRPAVDLYRSIGFRVVRTMYRTSVLEVPLAE
jgi:hypothetical protein